MGEACSSRRVKFLLKNASGCPCCMSTAPMVEPDASVSIVNGSLKLGRANTRAEVMADLR